MVKSESESEDLRNLSQTSIMNYLKDLDGCCSVGYFNENNLDSFTLSPALFDTRSNDGDGKAADVLSVQVLFPDTTNIQKNCQSNGAIPSTPLKHMSSPGVIDCDGIFDIQFPETLQKRKSMPLVYSSELNKLYCQMDVCCNMVFTLKNTDHIGPGVLYLRATPMFKGYESRNDPVHACHAHSEQFKQINSVTEVPQFDSWIKPYRDNSGMVLEKDSAGNFSLITEWAPNVPSLSVNYKFICRNTCIGGPNRRATLVSFELEDYQRNVLGKKVLEVKVCACPGRDIGKDLSDKSQHDAKAKEPKKNLENKKYYLEVEDQNTYELLANIRDTLEINKSVTNKTRFHPYSRNEPPQCHLSSHQETNKLKNSKRKVAFSPDSSATVLEAKGDMKISEWLSSFSFEAYAEAFSKAGYVNMKQILGLTLKEFNDLKIGLSDTKRLLSKLAEYQRIEQLSQPSDGGEAYGLYVHNNALSSSSED